ncbi:MAG: twin-arginine translocation signal domain-containing protein, partial [Verrucomicrobiota bacterium]
MNRRNFLKRAVVGAGALPFGFNALAQNEKSTVAPRKLILGSPLTHSDWMLKPNVAWGEEGVRHMLDMCKAAGWSKVYWRVFDGGRACYNSKLLRPMGKWDD